MIRAIPPVLLLPAYSLSFLAGVIILQCQSQLPSLYWGLLLIPLVIALIHLKKQYWLLFLFFGFFWANFHGWSYLESVPDVDITGQNVLISGVISDIPVKQSRATKFKFAVDDFELAGYNGAKPKYIRLSWYYTKVKLVPGQRWQFIVRLKPPNGFQNPGGFDYTAWLYQQNIHATGYVRKSELNKKLAESSFYSMIDRLRFTIKQVVNKHIKSEEASLINALAIGYRSDMQPELWQIFINTGTNHLIAISGLHIGLIAGFLYALLRLFARIKYFTPYLNQRNLLLSSFTVAMFYAALAGFTIPTQRALIMLFVVYLGVFLYRKLTVLQSLSFALFIVLIISPTSVLSVGFWLSFLAVAVISYSLIGRFNGRNKLLTWLWPQIVVIVLLIPLSLYFFQQTSVIALIANLIAIPAIALLILPTLLISLVVLVVHLESGVFVLSLSADMLSYLIILLRYLSECNGAVWIHSEASLVSVILATIGLLILFLPYAVPARSLSVFLILPLIFQKNEPLPENVFELHVLDVGQGLSVFVKTKNHNLLYDAGAKFSEKFDLGEKVVVPFLRHIKVNNLDRLIVSNGDNDHIGGAQSVLDNIKTASVIGRDINKLSHDSLSLCSKGQKWLWDGIQFEILHPEHQRYKKRNNYSCVLKISNKVNSVLITGDIEKKAERELLAGQVNQLKSSVLIVPHHGSKTSSSLAFLQVVNPEIAIYSSGYLNRYQFPRKEVVSRYQQLNIMQLNTAESGHIKVYMGLHSLKEEVVLYRQQYRRYWHRTAK